ncbi:MAG: preprotein translocase subunit YajC [Gammaproteobacteria bacterium]|nr:preprotein translocase subunit YajC [Gammaproteobacteria bacterium]MCW8887733.1 preprotein translocase subunit YajC [Gammaproteobacteria bacterium]
MSFFISDAFAEGAAAAQQQPGMLEALLPFIVLFIVFYFLLIRPQQKRAKEHKAMTEGLQKGEEVITTGGILGKVTSVDDEYVKVELNEGVEILMQRQAVASVLPKGSIKNIK